MWGLLGAQPAATAVHEDLLGEPELKELCEKLLFPIGFLPQPNGEEDLQIYELLACDLPASLGPVNSAAVFEYF